MCGSDINDSDRRQPDLDFKTGSRLQKIYLSESDVLDILQSLKINKANKRLTIFNQLLFKLTKKDICLCHIFVGIW